MVADIKLGATDAAGATVEAVYASRPPNYAVYRTKDRLMIHFADASAKEAEQRTALACLGPLRGEINGLIDGWRSSSNLRDRAKAAALDRRGADALVMALEGQPEGAMALLEAIKADVYDVRVSRARFQYLMVASAALAAAVIPIVILTSDWYAKAIFPFAKATHPLWLAAAAGAFGAFFSIATGIRNRTVLPDLRAGDNSADAVLRVVIGVIAATLLIFLLQSGVVATPSFGGRTVEYDPGKAATYSWAMVVVVAFTAGFLERLVPDLLADSAIATLKPAKPSASAAAAAATAATTAAAARAAAAASTPVEPSEDEDSCADRHGGADDTPDEELPAARGGVANV